MGGQNPRTRTGGFSLLELLGVIAIVVCLVALLVSTGSSFIKRAQITKCTGNLRQMGTAMGNYVADNNGRWPYVDDNRNVADSSKGTWIGARIKDADTGQWTGIGKLFPYLHDKRIYVCPADQNKVTQLQHAGDVTSEDGTFPCDYITRGFNQSYHPTKPKMMTLTSMGRRAVVSCNFAYATSNPSSLPPLCWHNGLYPVLFSDGSVQQIKFPANTVDVKNPPDIWDSTSMQMYIWDYFDGKTLTLSL